jgi:hypothetical protein
MIRYCFLLFLLFPPTYLFSQISNEAAYRQLLSQFFEKDLGTINSFEGTFVGDWVPKIVFDPSKSSTKVIMGELEIVYERIEDQQFKREVIIPMNIQDSTFRSEMLTYTDSLSITQIREIRKGSASPFKGDAPGRMATLVRPVTFVIGSIAGLISLFYIRSR